MMQLCTPPTDRAACALMRSQRFNIRRRLFYITAFATHLSDRHACLAVVKPKPVRSRQRKTSIEALEQNFLIRLPDDHKQYDDGTSTASKLCVTVSFLQYLNQEVGCVCFYERDCRLQAPLHHKLFKKKHNNNAEELLCYCLNVLLSLLFKKETFFVHLLLQT